MSAAGRSPWHGAEDGFTLIEALVTLGVAALVAGIAFPSLQGALGTSAFVAARNGVWLASRRARAEAIRRDERVILALSADGRTLIRNGAADFTLPEGVSLRLPRRGLIFHPDGTANGGDAVLGWNGRSQRLAVGPLTGLGGDR